MSPHIFHYLILLLSLLRCLKSASEDYPRLLLGNRANIQVIEALNPNNIELIMGDIDYTMSCDYIYSDNLIFWMDAATGQEKIQSTFTNVTLGNRVKRDVIKTGLVQPDGLACDWIAKKIYWTDAESNHIEVSELDGRTRKVLIWDQLDQPRAIAVDPLKGYMYWTDWGENPKIERAGMDGSNRKALVERDGIYWPNGLTIDFEEGKVYWVDANYHYINRMNTDGSGREVVVSNGPFNAGDNAGNYGTDSDWLAGSLQHPFSITLSGNRIYWTDWATNSIHSAVKNGTGQTTVVKDNISSLHDIHSYGPHRQKKGRNPCGKNNGGCSHLCLISPVHSNYTCACPTGVRLKPDGKTCKDGPKSILLLARRPDLRVISLDTPDFTDIVLPLKNVEHAVAIDYDPVDDLVYWSNNMKMAIFRAKLDGTNEEKIVSDEIEQCDGIAIDWVARNLYWAEAGRNYIAVSRLNGTSKRVIIEEGIDNPRAIALDPIRGQMYWSDWGNPKIERASLDGSDRYIFVNSSLQWPNGLAIDYKRGLLYWAEAFLNKIEVIGLNGSGRHVLLEEKIPHIFGFSLLDDYLYWSDWEKRKVERMLVYDKKSRHSLIDELPDLMGIKATSVDPIPASNPCAYNNGGCSHLCLFTPKGPKCQCPNGQELLSNMRSCIEPEAFLLFTLSSDGIKRISLETAHTGSVEVPFKRRVDAIHLDVSVQNDAIFWTDHEQMRIFQASMNGTNVRSIVDQGVSMLEGIAVDWLGHNIYWADSIANRIEMARLDGMSRRPVVVQDLDTPLSLSVDPINGYIYWSEWGGGKPKIRRAQMDGSHVTTLLGNGNVGRANSLTIDYEQKRLYWVDLDANEIVSSNMTGGDCVQIFASEDKSIFAMTLYHDYVYWTRGNTIERANKTTGADRQFIQTDMPSENIQDMLVYHTSRQSGITACSHRNGGCEHICLTVPGTTHQCTCPAHYKLRKDNVTCIAPESFLLFSQERHISRIVFERGVSGRQGLDTVLPIRDMKEVIAIEYDPLEDYVIWIDRTYGEIKKARSNGTVITTLLSNNRSNNHPYDMAVDPYGRMLYWTDGRNNSINAMRLDGTIIGTVISSTVRPVDVTRSKKHIHIMPRNIAVYPKNGQLFFSSNCLSESSSCRVSILRASVDGSDCLVLFSRGLKKISGLVIDQDAGRLYWSDEGHNIIESSDLNGNGRTTFHDDVTEPGALTIFGPNIYWIDKAQKISSKPEVWQIEADRRSGGHRKIIKGVVEDLQDLVGVVPIGKRSSDEYPCAKHNGGCSHICIGKEDGTIRCSCPTHLARIDEVQCGEAPTCNSKQFACLIKEPPCIPGKWRCDGDNDCDDHSDERDCPPCQSKDSFRCGTGVGGTEGETARAVDHVGKFLNVVSDIEPEQCVSMSMRCDGRKDCLDASDELNCPCAEHEWRCTNKMCIHKDLKCNGKDDCGDNSDEDCRDVTSTPNPQHDSTLIIIIICVTFCAVIAIVLVISFKRRKSRNNSHGGMVMYTRSRYGERIQVNVELTHADHVAQVDHNGSASHPVKLVKKPSGGRSTASVNFSIGPHNPDGPTHMVEGHMPQPHNHPALPGPHTLYGAIPYPQSTYNLNDHVNLPQFPRPNIPGASSSSSSSRANKQFLPTLNPPPSPATDRSGSKSTGECQYSSDSPSTRTASCYRCRNGHRHRRMHHHHNYMPAPHPTPCPSDSYDDGMSFHSGSGREYDSVSRRSKSGGAPSSPPPPYCHCYHHVCHPHMGYSGGYHPYPAAPSSCHSSHHGYLTPPIGHDPYHHSSSSSGSTRLAQQDCAGSCCHRQEGRHNHQSARKGGRGSSSHRPPRYNAMPYDPHSDSDPIAPPPTPRSQCLSDYCCTHDEADDNQDEDPTRFVNQLGEEDEGKRAAKETDPLIQSDSASDSKDNSNPPASKDSSTPSSCKDEEDASSCKEGKIDEAQPLLSQDPSRGSSSHTELNYPIFNPPPSPVTDSS